MHQSIYYIITNNSCIISRKNCTISTLSITESLFMVNSNPRIPFVTQDSLFVNENPVL